LQLAQTKGGALCPCPYGQQALCPCPYGQQALCPCPYGQQALLAQARGNNLVFFLFKKKLIN
jgi:hypothetical protein